MPTNLVNRGGLVSDECTYVRLGDMHDDVSKDGLDDFNVI